MSRNWAICVGINEYYSLKSLKYAAQDVIAMKDFFKQENFERVFYFSDESLKIETPKGLLRSEPTYGNLKRFFREFQGAELGNGDNLWFFFAGHGEMHGGHDYVMPIDVNPGDVEGTALKVSDIAASLRECGADNTVMLLDACRSEGWRGLVGVGTDEQPGIVTIYSCSAWQSSYEIDELGHGSFTYALLEGFRLQGAESCATVQRIDQYLRHRVPKLNQSYQKPSQTPRTAVEPISKMCLILIPQRARVEDIDALKLEAYRTEVFESQPDLSRRWWIRVLASKGADLEAIAALERITLQRMRGTNSSLLFLSSETTCESMSDVWDSILDVLAPRGTRMLMAQQGLLLGLDETTAVVGFRSLSLKKMAKERIPNLERAFEIVLKRSIKVSIEIPVSALT